MARCPSPRGTLALALLAGVGVSALGCQTPSNADHANELAARAGAERVEVPAGPFILTSYRRFSTGPGPALTIYIEGDGRAWETREIASRDPSPRRPVGLELALADPAPSVLYLARPCQLTTALSATGCHPRYWTRLRFAPEVIGAMNEAIEAARIEAGASRLELVGFSGGGVVATLIASRRDDVSMLVTLGAPLDLAAWSTHHAVSPLEGSIDPAAASGPPPATWQIHLVGARDEIVPPKLVADYVESRPERQSVSWERIEDYDHACCWIDEWAARIERYRERADAHWGSPPAGGDRIGR